MTEMLHIQLLGDFSLCYDDTIITTVQSPQEQSLLAYLLLHRETPQSRQHISFLFWPDAAEAQARRQLRKILFRLRRDLPQADDFLQVDTQTIQWRPDMPFVLDVASFEDGLVLAEQLIASGSRAEALLALDEALALYKGDLLPGCYDDWISLERERLSQSFVRALEEATTLLEMQREYTRAIDVAQRLLLHDPLHEPGYRSLMRLQALVGNRATALRVYHTCATTLQRELGVEPDADTRQVYERLLRTGVQTKSTSVLPLPVLAVSQPLVGRHQEWQQLLSIWHHAIGSVSQLVTVAGVAGIGKTRLAEELARWVKRQGHVVLTARCYAAEGELAYGPVVQWLRARPLPPLEPVWRRELARLLPELASDLPDATLPGPITEAWQRQRLFEALARAVLSGKSPLLLILDGVQWCDQETLVWLHYLLHFSAAAPLLILTTLRLEEVGVDHPLSAWMRSAQRVAPVHEIVLGSLTETETLSLAEKVAGQMLVADLAACIFSETEGNPLFVVEMVRAGKVGDAQDLACPLQGLPAQVQATIEGRLALLSSPARALTDVAAVVGREFTFDVLAQASDLKRDVSLAALDELWQRRIVCEQGGAGYDFTHDKLRQVAYASLTEAHRRALHRKVAVALEIAYGAGLAAVSGQIASHYARSGDPKRALPYFLRAADHAQKVYANDDAVALYERVLALTASSVEVEEFAWRVEALCGLGQVYLRVGQLSEAEAVFRKAMVLDKTLQSAPLRVARYAFWLGKTLHQQAQYEEEIRVGEEVLQGLDDHLESVEAVLILSMIASGYDYTGVRGRAGELRSQAAALIGSLPYVEALGTIYQQIYDHYLWNKDVSSAMLWLHMLESKVTPQNSENISEKLHYWMADKATQEGDIQVALAQLHHAVVNTTRTGDIIAREYYLFWLGYMCLSAGDLEEADEHARTSLEYKLSLGESYHFFAWGYWLRGLVLLCRGNGDEALNALEKTIGYAEELGFPEIVLWSHALIGRYCMESGHRTAALSRFQHAAQLCTPATFGNWRARNMKSYVHSFLSVLSGLEGAYADALAFRDFCYHFPSREQFIDGEQYSPDLARFALVQWYLETAVLAENAKLLLDESFADALPRSWVWYDAFGDCDYQAHDGLEIHAANGRDLWHINRSAPRVLCSLSDLGVSGRGNFAFGTVCVPASEDRLGMGGLLLWIDEENYLRLDRDSGGPHEITFQGCVDNRDVVIGRGQLKAGDDTPIRLPGSVTLRLEWADNHVRALCSLDGTAWFTVGYIDFPFSARAQFGVYAIGNIDRMIYQGAFSEGTAIRFASVRCWSLARGAT